MAKPTERQLELINKLSKKELTQDDCYVFSSLMIDNLPTSYYSIIHPNLLNTFLQDVKKGVALLLVHDTYRLPVGRSFDARLVTEYSEEHKQFVTSLYGDFYIPYNVNFEYGINSNDIINGIETGVNFATSIGFSAEKWTCSICGNDIRDCEKCPHIPGRDYEINNSLQKCYVTVGENGVGRLSENSFVYAGACKRAGILADISVTNFKDMYKLSTVEDFKNVPMKSASYCEVSKKEICVFFENGETPFSKDEKNIKRSEKFSMLDKIKEITSSFGFTFENENEFKENLSTFISSKLNEQKVKFETELNEVNTIVSNLKAELSEKESKIENLQIELSEKDKVIKDLEAEKVELSQKAELAEQYRKDLIEEALACGVRCQGNAFPKATFEKFLNSLSVDEIKGVISDFENEFNSKFDPQRMTKQMSEGNDKKITKADFETEEEFRAFIADEAVKLSKEQNISLREATKQLYIKYNKEGE